MIGILALQGNFESHETRLKELGKASRRITNREQLRRVQGLIIPGGESSVLLKLCDPEFRSEIKRLASASMPVLATCAGVIFLARHVENPSQESLDILDIDVRRNAYGRQVDSFIEPDLALNSIGHERLKALDSWKHEQKTTIEAVFIRAPKITRVGKAVTVLAEHQGDPVLIEQGNILGATFHPELSASTCVHEMFLRLL